MMVFAAGIHVRCQRDIGFMEICTSVPACAGNTISPTVPSWLPFLGRIVYNKHKVTIDD